MSYEKSTGFNLAINLGVVTPTLGLLGAGVGAASGAIAGVLLAAPVGAATVIGLAAVAPGFAVSACTYTICELFFDLIGARKNDPMRQLSSIPVIALGVITTVCAVSATSAALGVTMAVAANVALVAIVTSGLIIGGGVLAVSAVFVSAALAALGGYLVYQQIRGNAGVPNANP